MNDKELREEAARVLDELPEEFREQLHNIEIVVQKRPNKHQLAEMNLDSHEEVLYGLYEGVPLPDRSAFDPPLLPDKITLFSEPLLSDFPSLDDLREQIRLTVIHEIAHYFGMDDDEIEKLGY
ncbi:MAG TPA: metallopeptidase family protein [Candidatus Polarisedimenticolaceae bacterium]|nr:metallopeptidase family protein [Candidatus Polarisedimenticolaceae bacterium]